MTMRELTVAEVEAVAGGFAPAAACLIGGAATGGGYVIANALNDRPVHPGLAIAHFGAGCASGVLGAVGAWYLAVAGEIAVNAAITHRKVHGTSGSSAHASQGPLSGADAHGLSHHASGGWGQGSSQKAFTQSGHGLVIFGAGAVGELKHDMNSRFAHMSGKRLVRP